MISFCIKENNAKILESLINKFDQSNISDIYYSRHSFKIYDNIIIHYKGKNANDFYNFLAKILCNEIILFYEPKIVRRLINFEYFYFDKPDKKVIFDEYKILINKFSDKDISEKNDIIVNEIVDYLKSHKSIVLNGFVTFRLPNYMSYLKFFVQESVNQFILDKEYLEFVNLLKGYVDSKVPANKVVNLVYVGSEAILLNDGGDIIDLDSFDSIYLSDITFSNNDYVLNTLVGMLPSKIILHLITPTDNFIDTIKLIFGNKVTSCNGCDLCHAYKVLNLK